MHINKRNPYILILLLLLSLFCLTVCSGCGSNSYTLNIISSNEPPVNSDGTYSPVLLEQFIKAASQYGMVKDSSVELGIDAASVSSDSLIPGDSVNLIYMLFPDAYSAEAMIFDADNVTPSSIQVVKTQDNYALYEEKHVYDGSANTSDSQTESTEPETSQTESPETGASQTDAPEADSSQTGNLGTGTQGNEMSEYDNPGAITDSSYYGYYLRVDGMVIFVTGPLEDSDKIKAKATDFFLLLGYGV